LSIGFNRLGQVNLKLGKTDVALAALDKAMKINEALAHADPDSTEASRDLAIDYFRLGNVNARTGQTAQAQQFFTKALALYESLARQSPDAQSRHDVTVAYNKLGDLSMALDQLQPALEWYGKSVKAATAAAAEFKSAPSKQDLSIACGNLGRASLLAGLNEQALTCFSQAMEIDHAAAKAAPHDASLQHDVVSDMNNVALAASQLGKHSEAAEYYRQALAELDRLQQAGLLLEDQKALPAKLRQKIDDESRKAAQTQPATAPR
jgi:tetratricopeptide (TPR) repeat protein